MQGVGVGGKDIGHEDNFLSQIKCTVTVKAIADHIVANLYCKVMVEVTV